MSAPKVLLPKPNTLAELFGIEKPVIGVIHLMPLPGAPCYDGEAMSDIFASAISDAKTLTAGGIDGIIVENAGDLPFSRPELIGPETIAALTAACLEVRSADDTPIGITCVANGAIPGLAIAKPLAQNGCASING